MGIFTRVSSDAFQALQLDAGVLLTTFDPANPYIAPTDAQIIATTSGGIKHVCKATYSDFAEGVDNVGFNMMEFKHLDGWDCSMSFTSIKFNAEGVKLALGAANIEMLSNGVHEVSPRRSLSQSDFVDIWWVGDKADGGAAAIQLKNALSTEGYSMQTSKNGKGTVEMTISGHMSINAQDDVPMKFYDIPPQSGANTVPVRQNLSNVTSDFSGSSIQEHGSLDITLSAADGYEIDSASIVVTMGGVDITSLCVTSTASTASIAIDNVTAGVVITASASVEE